MTFIRKATAFAVMLGIVSVHAAESAGKFVIAPGISSCDGVWDLSGKKEALTLKNSEKNNIGKSGMTISAALRLKAPRPITGSGFDAAKNIICNYDMIASKGNSFSFGRRADMWVDQLYFNFSDGKSWVVPLKAGQKTPEYGKWAVWSAVIQPMESKEEGYKLTVVTLYLNGEQMHRFEAPALPVANNEPIRFGTGLGINNEPWNFNGEIAEMICVNKALSDDEIFALAKNSKLVKVNPSDALVQLPSPVLAKFADAEKTASLNLSKWLVSALRRYAVSGGNLAEISALIGNDRLLSAENDEIFIDRFNKTVTPFKLIATPEIAVLFFAGKSKGVTPLSAVLDRRTGREIFGRRLPRWEIEAVKKGKNIRISTGNADLSSEIISQNKETVTARAIYTAEKISVIENFRISGAKIESSIEVENNDTAMLLKNLRYPVWRLAPGNIRKDFYLHPRQSGILYPNPTLAALPPAGWYPSGWLNMQFAAYYDDIGGIYAACEDPENLVKHYQVRGRGGDLEIAWSHPVARNKNSKGGNKFTLSGSAVLQPYQGEWFEAAEIYRNFVENKAGHGKTAVTSPKWFLENTLWLGHWTFNERDIKQMPQKMKRLRDYLELPFAVHWYRWNDPAQGSMPHYYAKPGVVEALKEIKKHDIYLKPYIDSRLWSELDGPDRASDREFKRLGQFCAIVNADGSWNYERYSSKCREVVMCPSAPVWQDKILALTKRTADYGFDMVYHDQVGASRPFCCFDKKHDHQINSNRAWLDGYREMFDKIAKLRQSHPELCHDTEDANEAYADILDGMMPWRWLDSNQVPLFAAVYAGRTQFTGRGFEEPQGTDPESFFVKLAIQLINGEQLGWFTLAVLEKDPQRLVFTKRLAHIRLALLDYFNNGKMDAPVKYTAAPEEITMLWAGGGTKPHPVTTPAILSSTWKHPELGRMILFVNPGKKEAVAEVAPGAMPGKFFLCTSSVLSPLEMDAPGKLILAPEEVAVYCENKAQAEKIQKILTETAKFTAGSYLKASGILAPQSGEAITVEFDDELHPDAFRGTGALAINGQKGRTIQRKFPTLLEPDRTYTLSFMMRKRPGVEGYVTVANYDKQNTMKQYASTGQTIPKDGQYHKAEVTFTTDKDLNRCSIFVNNYHSDGVLLLDDLKLECVK